MSVISQRVSDFHFRQNLANQSPAKKLGDVACEIKAKFQDFDNLHKLQDVVMDNVSTASSDENLKSAFIEKPGIVKRPRGPRHCPSGATFALVVVAAFALGMASMNYQLAYSPANSNGLSTPVETPVQVPARLETVISSVLSPQEVEMFKKVDFKRARAMWDHALQRLELQD